MSKDRDVPGAGLVLVMPPQSKKMVALDRLTGEERWRVDLPFPAHAFVLQDDVIVAASANGEACAVSMDGERLWHNELSGLGLGIPLLALPGTTKQGRV